MGTYQKGKARKKTKAGFRRALVGELKKGDVYWWGDPVNGSITDKWTFEPTYESYVNNINNQIKQGLIYIKEK